MSFNHEGHSTVPQYEKFEMKLPGCEILGTAARILAPLTNFPRAPAAGQTCHRYGKLNQFSKYCLSKIPASSKRTQKGKQKKIEIPTETKSSSSDTFSSETGSDNSHLYATLLK